MNLPNYFLADMPAEATLNAAMISDACQTLRRNRERYLATRSTESLIHILSELARNWRDPDFSFRKKVIENSAATGFTESILNAGLDAFFSQITEENLENLLVQELGDRHRLDKLVSDKVERDTNRASLVRGPELLVHITGGMLPNPTLTSIIFGLLVRSAQFVKCASGTSLIPRMFAHSLYEVEPKLAACIEMAEWKGGEATLEQALFTEADCITATGSDETLAKIKSHVPAKARFLGYGHRVSFGYVAHDVLSSASARKAVSHAAQDVIAWNQLGCLSPHVFYVETGGTVTPEKFAELLADELQTQEQNHPRGMLNHQESATISYRRSFYEVRAAGSTETRIWQSEGSTAWTVVFETDARFQLSCLNRFIYVKAVANLRDALRGADTVHGKVSTVGIAAGGTRTAELAKELARWGATRICPLGQMQNPPLTWRHDGRPALADLVTWTDLEFS